MNERQRLWLIIAIFVLIFGLMSAVIQRGARRPPPAGQEGPASGAFPRPVEPKPAPEGGVKVDPLRGVVGSDDGAKYFQ